jgi:hypothetical protein
VTASAENAPGESAKMAFDGDKGTKWLAFATTGFVQAQLAQPIAVTGYALTAANDTPERDPRDWMLQGSTDGTTWTTVDSRAGETFGARGETKMYTVAAPQPFTFYRLTVTANAGAPIVQVAEVELANPDVPTPVPADGTFAGWMRDRFADGHWAPGFSPSTGTGFVEGSSAQYTWMVYSDVVGLAAQMGGTSVARQRLDAFFRNPDGSFDLSATLDTRFDATNEPDIQTPYIYNYLGAASRTQETVRAVINGRWSNGTGGIPGNDDAGTMSAWYVFSALGLYPTVPTRAELALTSPLFPHAVVHLSSGANLVIDAPGAAADQLYVHGLRVNGHATTKAWLPASAVRAGAHLVYALAATPDAVWGSGPGDLPPQLTTAQTVSAAAVRTRAGARFTGTVATVTDPDTPAAALTATISWGDGTTSRASVGDGYVVTADHTYRRPGRYPTTVTVSDPGGVTVVASTGTATVTR